MATKLLCIDDEPRIVTLLVEDLSEQGFEVLGLVDNTTAIREIEKFKPDLVLCDVKMPPPNGFDILETLRARQDKLATIPFVFPVSYTHLTLPTIYSV